MWSWLVTTMVINKLKMYSDNMLLAVQWSNSVMHEVVHIVDSFWQIYFQCRLCLFPGYYFMQSDAPWIFILFIWLSVSQEGHPSSLGTTLWWQHKIISYLDSLKLHYTHLYQHLLFYTLSHSINRIFPYLFPNPEFISL